jgi:hypothetical protein
MNIQKIVPCIQYFLISSDLRNSLHLNHFHPSL